MKPLFTLIYRFRLATICNDSTGILPIIFPDEEIQRILGRNVFEIENDENEVRFLYTKKITKITYEILISFIHFFEIVHNAGSK